MEGSILGTNDLLPEPYYKHWGRKGGERKAKAFKKAKLAKSDIRTLFSKNLGLQKINLVSLRSSKIMVSSHRALQSSSPHHGPSNSLSSIFHLRPCPLRSFFEDFLKL